MNKVIGMALLAAGLALIGCAFNSPDLAGPGVSHLLPGVPAEKAPWLLLGGSAVVVLGEAMIFHYSSRN